MQRPWPPSGVVTRDDGSWDFDFTAYPHYADEWTAYRRFGNPHHEAALLSPDLADQAAFQHEANRFNGTFPAPPAPDDCASRGCWCKNVPDGMAFHCVHCADAFDAEYQCRDYARWCIACCGHPECSNGWYTDHYLPV